MLILVPIILGIVQGITEWLPISSTGHLILINSLLGGFINVDISDYFIDFFLIIIQLSSVLAVIYYFFNELNPFSKKKNIDEKKETISLWLKVAVACIPVVVVGLLINDIIDNLIIIIIMLITFGISFIIVENFNKNKTFKINKVSDIGFKLAFFIGLIQVLAIVPGTSRSGVTILGGMILGLNRVTSAKFSFFLAIPVMIGASLLNGFRFFLNHTLAFNEIVYLIVGSVTSFAISILVIKFLLDYIKKYNFKVFGYYRITLGLILLIIMIVV